MDNELSELTKASGLLEACEELIEEGRFREAQKMAEEIVEIIPLESSAYHLLALTHFHQGHISTAADYVRKAKELLGNPTGN